MKKLLLILLRFLKDRIRNLFTVCKIYFTSALLAGFIFVMSRIFIDIFSQAEGIILYGINNIFNEPQIFISSLKLVFYIMVNGFALYMLVSLNADLHSKAKLKLEKVLN